MRSSTLLNAAAAVVALAAGIAGWLLVPALAWSTAAIAGYGALLLSLGLACSPTFGLARGADDAAAIASVGPVAVWSFWQVLLTAATFAAALAGLSAAAWAMLVLWAGSVVLLLLYVQAGAKLVHSAGADYRDDRARFVWRQQLTLARESFADHGLRALADELLDAMEFAPSSHTGRAAAQDAEISLLVQAIARPDHGLLAAEARETLERIGRLLSVRRAVLLEPRR